jgi:hypothetical protein
LTIYLGVSIVTIKEDETSIKVKSNMLCSVRPWAYLIAPMGTKKFAHGRTVKDQLPFLLDVIGFTFLSLVCYE